MLDFFLFLLYNRMQFMFSFNALNTIERSENIS